MLIIQAISFKEKYFFICFLTGNRGKEFHLTAIILVENLFSYLYVIAII